VRVSGLMQIPPQRQS